MRKTVKGSIRKLTSRHLVVNWHGHNHLFYQMTKTQVRNALKNGTATVQQEFDQEGKIVRGFPVHHLSSGSIAIGCEHFNKEEVAELKKWSKA